MRVPLAWLREYLSLAPNPAQIVDHFAALGFPVEAIETPPLISGVVVGRIEKLSPHPNADRLQLCEITIAGPRNLIIATAATNVAPGQIIPVARIGAQLPELTITPRKMRGIDSEGMLCSAAELGLPAAWFEDGILQFDTSCPIGADVVELLGLADPILEVEVTTNRPDALSLLGLARELAALTKSELRLPRLGEGLVDLDSLPAPSACSHHFSHPLQNDVEQYASQPEVQLLTPNVCEFLAIRVMNPPLGPGPILHRVRLAQAGIRPINAAVDITNYVLLEYGRPTHLYDAEKVAKQTLIIRQAHPNEALTTLDGVERILQPEHLVVADPDAALSLAGVMGGSTCSVHATTSQAILECAQFRGAPIRRGAMSLGLRTESSSRFEKGLAHGMLHEAAARVAYLLQKQNAIVCKPVYAGEPALAPATIRFDTRDIAKLLGFTVDSCTFQTTLTNLGFTLQRDNLIDEIYQLTPPPWRVDIELGVDVIEEIARLIGYDRIEPAFAPVAPTGISSFAYNREREIAHALCRAGFQEVVSPALEPADMRERCIAAGFEPLWPSLEIRNPLSAEQSTLRFSLLPAIMNLLHRRSRELRDAELHLFEIGQVFGSLDRPCETRQVLWCSARRRVPLQQNAHHGDPPLQTWQDDNLLTFKGKTEAILQALLGYLPPIEQSRQSGFHPGKCGIYKQDAQVIAAIGCIDPRLLAAFDLEINLAFGLLNLESLPQAVTRYYQIGSKYPSIHRDLALVLDIAIPAQRLSKVIVDHEPLARSARVFDEFRGSLLGISKKNLTVRITLQRDDGTLTDDDADMSVKHILEAVKTELGAELRK